MSAMRVWTVGHSNRGLTAFLDMLKGHGIEAVADVRRFPASRRNPHFNAASLAASLSEAGIDYAHYPELGGRRRPSPASPNTGLRSEAFRAFADYMSTDEFSKGLQRLIQAAAERRTAIMCAEAVPWRCHRSLISDALAARGIEVVNVVGPGPARPHAPSPAARLQDGAVTYPSLL